MPEEMNNYTRCYDEKICYYSGIIILILGIIGLVVSSLLAALFWESGGWSIDNMGEKILGLSGLYGGIPLSIIMIIAGWLIMPEGKKGESEQNNPESHDEPDEDA